MMEITHPNPHHTDPGIVKAISSPTNLITALTTVVIYLTIFGPTTPTPSTFRRLFFGISKKEYYHSVKNSLRIRLKDGSTTTFAELVKSTIPACRLNPFLFNGHLQTIWTAFVKTEVDVYYKRWTFEQSDPTFAGSFAIDFVTDAYDTTTATTTTTTASPGRQKPQKFPPRTTHYTAAEFETIGSDDSRPMLVVLHGLSGGSHELYLREVLGRLVLKNSSSTKQPVEGKRVTAAERQWEACVVNSRGCAGTEITSSVLYNARSTWDVRQAVRWLRKTFPNRPLYGCGFSLGANIMTNYIGEEGARCEFKAAAILSSPWNLEVGNRALQRTWIGRNIYSRAMGTSLRDLFTKHFDQLSRNPAFDLDAIKKLQYLHEFDTLVQCPSWGYPTAAAYYRDASSTDSLLNARIPILAISAEDDPVVSRDALPYEEVQQTPYAVLCATALGGHLSWFEFGGGRWFADATSQFFQRMALDVDFDSLPKSDDVALNGHAGNSPKNGPAKPIYAPLRRRWHVPER